MNLGPQNLDLYFNKIKAMIPNDLDEVNKFKLKESNSSPQIQSVAVKETDSRNKTANPDGFNKTIDVG